MDTLVVRLSSSLKYEVVRANMAWALTSSRIALLEAADRKLIVIFHHNPGVDPLPDFNIIRALPRDYKIICCRPALLPADLKERAYFSEHGGVVDCTPLPQPSGVEITIIPIP